MTYVTSLAGRTNLLFLACFVVAQADKQVMGLLAVSVQDAFGLTNAELGFLQGAAFALAYAIGGVPIARLIDGGNRVRIAAACVGLWSVATMMCGLAGSFLMLAALRAATAVAEAGLPPAAFSIFSQSGDQRRMTRLTSTFMLAPFVGGGLVLALGGALIRVLADRSLTLPGWSAPWRAVFLAVGLPGMALAVLLAVYGTEPARPAKADARVALPSIARVIATIFGENRFLRYYFLGLATFLVLNFAVGAWYPALLVHRFGMTTASAGGHAGIVFLLAGVCGTLVAGHVAPLRKAVSIGIMVRDYLASTLVLVPVAIGLAVAGSVTVSLSCYAVYAFLTAAITASMAVPIQLSLANTMLARGIAVFSLLTSAAAGTAGPLLVGMIADRTTLSLGAALAITGGGATMIASVLLAIAYREARRADPAHVHSGPFPPDTATAR